MSSWHASHTFSLKRCTVQVPLQHRQLQRLPQQQILVLLGTPRVLLVLEQLLLLMTAFLPSMSSQEHLSFQPSLQSSRCVLYPRDIAQNLSCLLQNAVSCNRRYWGQRHQAYCEHLRGIQLPCVQGAGLSPTASDKEWEVSILKLKPCKK